MKRVVITGIGVVSPIGAGKEIFLDSIKKGISGIKRIDELSNLNFNCQIGGIPDTQKSEFLPILEKYNLADSSSTIKYSCLAAIEAWLDAGFSIPDYNSQVVDQDTGIIIGSGFGSIDLIGNKLIPLVNEGKLKKIRSSTIEQLIFSAPAALLSGILATGNFLTSNSNACSTGTESVLLGFDAVRNGKAKRMIVGSAEGYSPYYWAIFDALRVTATSFNETPEKGCRPMSEKACGLVPSAGAGILILEELEAALLRGAKIYAEIGGGYLNSGGQRNGGTMTAPNPAGVISCIKGAIVDAHIDASQIDCISGHLSSTMADVIEIKNWTKALNLYGTDFPFINSLKSITGHCLGASGSIEVIAAVLEIYHQFIHPSINCEDVHPEISKLIDPGKIPQNLIENQSINFVAKTSFGFGDVNSCVILKKL